MPCCYCETPGGVTIPIGSVLLAHRRCFVEADTRSEALEREGARLDHRILGEFPVLTGKILSAQWVDVDTSMAGALRGRKARRPGPTDREIAERLGLTVSALRGRIRRKTLDLSEFGRAA